MSDRNLDVAVVGAGIMGSALALELATSGLKVLLLDSVAVCAGSSSRSSGGVRHQFERAANIELASRTIQRLESFEEDFGVDPSFRQIGYLFLSSNERTLEVMRRAVDLQRSLGVPSHILGREDVGELVAGIVTDDLVGASYCPKDGFIDPPTVTQAFVAAARARGATIMPKSGLVSVRTAGDRAVEIETATGERFGIGILANTAGVWAPRVAAMYGATLPIQPWRSQTFMVTDTPDVGPRTPMVIDFDNGRAYFHPEGPGLLVGMDNEGMAEPEWEPQLDWSKFPDIAEAISRRLPAIADGSAASGWAGFLELTPDEDPIVGWTHLENVYTAAGFSGHGLSIAPGLAEQVGREIQGEPCTVDISSYRLERFARGARPAEGLSMR